jgi:ribose transport system substrate-binding protein
MTDIRLYPVARMSGVGRRDENLAWLAMLLALVLLGATAAHADGKRFAHVVSDLRIPFWSIMKRGIEQRAGSLGYKLDVYSAENNARCEVAFVAKAIWDKVDGLIISPTNSSGAVTLLWLAERARIPVVIPDIGADGGSCVSDIGLDNFEGSYQMDKLLAAALRPRQWDNGTMGQWDKGQVGIIAIPQRRANGKARTAGFMKAQGEAGIKGGALWLQGSDRYQGALDAISDSGRKGQRFCWFALMPNPRFST